MKAALLAIGAIAGLLALARPLEPFSWGHRLSRACTWLPDASAQAFGREYPEPAAQAAERACWARRGAHGSGYVRIIERTWPDAAQLAAWNGETR